MRNFELGFVLRSAGSDCSNNGPTCKYDFLYVFRESVSKEQIREWLKEKSAKNTGDRFDALEDKCVYLKKSNNYVWAEMVFKRPDNEGHYCAGGNYICSSDASFIDMVGHSYPISVHDRFETWPEYNALSI